MKPGCELDLLVTEKVMGLIPAALNQVRKPESNNSYFVCPYSTDISAAWEVVEKMKDDHMVDVSWNHATKKWHATINEHTKASESALHAICLVALKVCGVDV